MTTVVLAAGGASWEAAAIGEIEQAAHLRLVRRCVDVTELIAVARTAPADLALVDAGLPGLDVEAVRQIEATGVVVAAVGDPTLASRMGIDRMAQVGRLAAVDLTAAVSGRATPREALVVAVWGPSGAPGRSTLALSSAASMAARGLDVALVDADTTGGSLGQMLGVLDDVSGLMAACRIANQGHPQGVDGHLVRVGSRLNLLTGLPRGDMWPHVRIGPLDRVLDRVRAIHDVVVVDVGSSLEAEDGIARSRNQAGLHVLAEADHVLVVGRADPVGLARLVRAVVDLGDLDLQADRDIVINQLRPTSGWSEREVRDSVARLTGMDPSMVLPWDAAGLDAAVMAGRTAREVAPGSPFVSRVDLLVRALLATYSMVVSPRPE